MMNVLYYLLAGRADKFLKGLGFLAMRDEWKLTRLDGF